MLLIDKNIIKNCGTIVTRCYIGLFFSFYTPDTANSQDYLQKYHNQDTFSSIFLNKKVCIENY